MSDTKLAYFELECLIKSFRISQLAFFLDKQSSIAVGCMPVGLH